MKCCCVPAGEKQQSDEDYISHEHSQAVSAGPRTSTVTLAACDWWLESVTVSWKT